jgi:hypothetical protein
MENKSCKPVNTKSLLAFTFGQMEKLDNGEIDANTANAQANLIKQANNILDYELKRSIVLLKLAESGYGRANQLTFRDIESKAFDDTKMLENN